MQFLNALCFIVLNSDPFSIITVRRFQQQPKASYPIADTPFGMCTFLILDPQKQLSKITRTVSGILIRSIVLSEISAAVQVLFTMSPEIIAQDFVLLG